MAFLNNLTLRPSCVFSGLPPQFLEPLICDLGTSIAASTCDLVELRDIVRLRSASLVVVGASSESYEIAEQLSHEEVSVKVFLVRFDDDFPEPGYKNGFAGIVDLRTDSEQFAETLRRAAHADLQAGNETPFRGDRHLREEFVSDGRQNDAPVCELSALILDQFLEIARTSKGLFLKPCVGGSTFEVISQVGFKGEMLPCVAFDPAVLMALRKGQIVESTKGQGLELGWQTPSGRPFTLAVPLLCDSALQGCLLGNQTGNLDEIMEFGRHASRLLAQAGALEVIEILRSSIAIAQKQPAPSWMLLSDDGKVLHQEACPELFQVLIGEIIRAPRLRAAIGKAANGESGTIDFKGHSFTYGRINGAQVNRILLILNPISQSDCPSPEFSLPPEVLRKIVDQELRPLSEVGLSPENIARLDQCGSEVSQCLQTMARALVRCVDRKLIFDFKTTAETATILFEVEESLLEHSLSEEVAALPANWIILAVQSVIGFKLTQPRWSAGTFGGKVIFRISSGYYECNTKVL